MGLTPVNRYTNRVGWAPSGAAARADAEQLGAAWRAAREQSKSAYHGWGEAAAAQRRLAYAAFLAAAAREPAAGKTFLLIASHA